MNDRESLYNIFNFCSVFKTSLHYKQVAKNSDQKPDAEDGTKAPEADTDSVTAEEVGGIEDAIDKFYGSIKSRMMVGEVITNIENNAHFTFDFLMLLILASIIAFIGLGVILYLLQFQKK